ncbi:DNA repair protein complementing XP-C cells homolog [Maniola jurtina]|uniref:DNA repair protein complementing XP-C cells homolog n=1 Tax=Maniola jurtina TaxID=191418 RepID=UPI001E687CAD|nr:DNA repair protein complementing XP-C cells homolog [Maniola jurtina]
MPTTRKKVVKTVYKDEDESEQEDGHDFSDSGSEAEFSDHVSSDEEEECPVSSDEDFKSTKGNKNIKRASAVKKVNKANFRKSFITKINKQQESEENADTPVLFSVKDLTDSDKLLPSILNLSESDSSDDESPRITTKKAAPSIVPEKSDDSENETESKVEYKDVWANNIHDESEEIAKKTFLELEQHKNKMEETKISIQNYAAKMDTETVSNVKDLLALGEEEMPQPSVSSQSKKRKKKVVNDDSDSEMEDWEEVKEAKAIPQQGLQLIVDIPNAVCRKTKKLDVEMMMKRKINRVKKEYQVYMHKVHVLCWLAHGNYVSGVLNDQTIMAAALSLVPSKECYPGERVDMKYVEQITSWYKDKVTLKQDKHENKFRPKAPPLKDILQQQIKNRVFTTKKYIVFVFVSMLRSLGLQCRVMFNFVTLPIRPPSSELCSLSTKSNDAKNEDKKENNSSAKVKQSGKKRASSKSKASKEKIPQLDGNYDMSCSSDSDNIMQVDGNDDSSTNKTKKQKNTTNSRKHVSNETNLDEGIVSPPKRARRNCRTQIQTEKEDRQIKNETSPKKLHETDVKTETAKSRKSLSLNRLESKNIVQPEPKDEKISKSVENLVEQVKSSRRTRSTKNSVNATLPKPEIQAKESTKTVSKKTTGKVPETKVTNEKVIKNIVQSEPNLEKISKSAENLVKRVKISRRTKNTENSVNVDLPKSNQQAKGNTNKTVDTAKVPEIIVTNENDNVSSKYFGNDLSTSEISVPMTRKRSKTSEPIASQSKKDTTTEKRVRAKSTQNNTESKYFTDNIDITATRKTRSNNKQIGLPSEDGKRVSHRDLQKKAKGKNDVTDDLIHIIKGRVREAKEDSKKLMVKEKIKKESDEDSDYLPVESPKGKISESDDDFKPTKTTPKSRVKTVKKVDRRVISTDDELQQNNLNKIDVWCEVFVEELEEWIAVDVIKGNVHCVNEIYGRATHPVTYVVGWDNNNYLKDLTRKYVPHWNTITRKQRVEPVWWDVALKPWLGPKTARDREEDERLDRMQLEAPLPKVIGEYKNHPLYALKRHLLKFEAIYPPEAPTLGFVRGEPVYARDCVYVCRSRDTWLKEAKVVKLGEQPYKVVKARPKWDRLSNKLITDKPLEVFGPWQVQDYEPPTAENGIVPRNAYGNVELFKDCMLPKGTVHLKLPGLNRVAKKLNIDCAPAMTGFDFNGGWSHPVYDGFVVCKEFEEVITEAWIKDQEDQERKEQEKIEARVYGHWRKLIRGLLIKERLKAKYGFEEPSTSQDKKKGPRLVVKKK